MATSICAQTDSNKTLSLSSYIETYYLYDFNKPSNGTRPAFVYSHNRHHEVNINLALIKAAWQQENLRANLALATGTYMNANLTSEPGVLKNLYEANAGVKLSAKKDIWIDAGVFPSHIGFEGAIGKDCQALTRSMMADNSPYYEAGAKLSYTTANGKWFVSGLLLNGWQRIQRPDGNSSIAVGHQLTFKPSEKLSINSSSFVGNDKPDSIRRMRYFHNLYTLIKLNQSTDLTLALDIGAEQKFKNSRQYNIWYTPVCMLKKKAWTKHSFTGRIEYYSDRNNVIIPSINNYGFESWGWSLNYDYAITTNIVWRSEFRALYSKDPVFEKGSQWVNNNYVLSGALAISF